MRPRKKSPCFPTLDPRRGSVSLGNDSPAFSFLSDDEIKKKKKEEKKILPPREQECGNWDEGGEIKLGQKGGGEGGRKKGEEIKKTGNLSVNIYPYRLKQESHGGAWCPKLQITTEPREWLEIDLHTVHMITATGTQGRFGNGQGVEYSEAYMLEYWRPKLGKWVRYRDVRGEEVSIKIAPR